VQVPRRLHHRVTNDGRTKNELRRRFQVHVSHDGADIPRLVPTNGTLGRIDEDEEQYPWHVVKAPEDSSDESIPWKLRGQESNLQKAKRFLDDIIQSVGKLGNWTGNLGVPPEHHHLVIGTGGQRISQIRQETDCTVDVPRRGDGNDVIVIRGTRDGIEKAKDMILESVESRSRR
jgi:KH domain